MTEKTLALAGVFFDWFFIKKYGKKTVYDLIFLIKKSRMLWMVLTPSNMDTLSPQPTAPVADFSMAQNQSDVQAHAQQKNAESPVSIRLKSDPNFSSSVQNIEQKISDDVFEEETTMPKQKISPVMILKNASIFFWVLSLVGFVWLTFDLHPENKYLKHIGLVENTGKKHARLQTEQSELLLDINTKQQNIAAIEQKIENQDFSDLEGSIASIQDGQVDWYDRRDGETYIFGLKDMLVHLQDYFNSRYYQDPEKIISGRSDQVIIKDYSINRDGAQVNVQVSHVLGRVFFLANEFVDMVNAVPFLKNGSVSSYSRQKNDIGDDTMEFALSLERQMQADSVTTDFTIDLENLEALEDPYDIRFVEFLDWFKEHRLNDLP